MFELDQKLSQKDEDIYHFIAYVPINGRLYELDGLKEGPIDRGEIPTGVHWVEYSQPVIESRINKYAEGEIHFNLMAIISDRKMAYEKQLAELTSSNSMNDEITEMEISNLHNLIEREDAKMRKYREGVLR